MSSTPPPVNNKPARKKRALFRLLAILLGLVPLLIFELILRGIGVGKPEQYNDPFVGFDKVQPLFVLNENEQQYEVAQPRRTFFRNDTFAARKGANEYRIFVLGGSTVQGRPWGIETSFTSWLELSLNAASPETHWQVVNCGGISYASYRLTLILKEVLQYEPDLIILCTGHNEFLEDRTYKHIKNAPEILTWSQRRLSRFRTYNLMRSGIIQLLEGESIAAEEPKLSSEVDARLDWKGEYAKYHHDDEWHRGVMQHFDASVRGMISLCQDAEVPIILVAPVSNLEWAPFKSEHKPGLTPTEIQKVDQVLQGARKHWPPPPGLEPEELQRRELAAHEAYQRAIAIDERFAKLHFEQGHCYSSFGAYNEAKQAFLRAQDEDVVPLRMLEPMRDQLHVIASETNTPFLDAQNLFEQLSPNGIPGENLFVDHVHPTVEGHQKIARALLDVLVEEDLLTLSTDWDTKREQAYEQHLRRLPDDYYAKGEEHRKAVQRWGHGQSDQTRANGE